MKIMKNTKMRRLLIQLLLIGGIYTLISLIPSLSVTIRRLHDVNKSGWNLLWLITIIAIPYVLYLEIKKGNDGPNNYGEASTN